MRRASVGCHLERAVPHACRERGHHRGAALERALPGNAWRFALECRPERAVPEAAASVGVTDTIRSSGCHQETRGESLGGSGFRFLDASRFPFGIGDSHLQVRPLAPPATVRAASAGGTPVRDGRAGVRRSGRRRCRAAMPPRNDKYLCHPERGARPRAWGPPRRTPSNAWHREARGPSLGECASLPGGIMTHGGGR